MGNGTALVVDSVGNRDISMENGHTKNISFFQWYGFSVFPFLIVSLLFWLARYYCVLHLAVDVHSCRADASLMIARFPLPSLNITVRSPEVQLRFFENASKSVSPLRDCPPEERNNSAATEGKRRDGDGCG